MQRKLRTSKIYIGHEVPFTYKPQLNPSSGAIQGGAVSVHSVHSGTYSTYAQIVEVPDLPKMRFLYLLKGKKKSFQEISNTPPRTSWVKNRSKNPFLMQLYSPRPRFLTSYQSNQVLCHHPIGVHDVTHKPQTCFQRFWRVLDVAGFSQDQLQSKGYKPLM